MPANITRSERRLWGAADQLCSNRALCLDACHILTPSDRAHRELAPEQGECLAYLVRVNRDRGGSEP
jgi:hypothetical protein